MTAPASGWSHRVVERPVAATAAREPRTLAARLALLSATYGLPAGGWFALPVREYALLWNQLARARHWQVLLQGLAVQLGTMAAHDEPHGPARRRLESLELEVAGG